MGIDKFRRKVKGISEGNFESTQNMLRVVLTNTEGAGGIISESNPLGVDVMVTRIVLDVTTLPTATPTTFDIGCEAATATTSDDSLLNEVSIGSPEAIYQTVDNVTNGGVDGRSAVRWESDEYLTGTAATGSPQGMAGIAYIYYVKI